MTPYEQGFMSKCAELGVDPRALVKAADLKAKSVGVLVSPVLRRLRGLIRDTPRPNVTPFRYSSFDGVPYKIPLRPSDAKSALRYARAQALVDVLRGRNASIRRALEALYAGGSGPSVEKTAPLLRREGINLRRMARLNAGKDEYLTGLYLRDNPAGLSDILRAYGVD